MGVTDDFAPSFTQKPALRQEDDGNRLLFECQLLAAPQPDIEWYRSDELLKEDSRTKFKIQSLGDNKYFVVLDLDDVVETDAGLYKVKARNKMGEVAASINLNFSRKYFHHFLTLPMNTGWKVNGYSSGAVFDDVLLRIKTKIGGRRSLPAAGVIIPSKAAKGGRSKSPQLTKEIIKKLIDKRQKSFIFNEIQS